MVHCTWKQIKVTIPRNIVVGANNPHVFPLRSSHLIWFTNVQAKKLNATLEQIRSVGEDYIAKAEAKAWATQILAEMLGVVCHEDYYKYGDQMVSPIPLIRKC
jgi:hypothetical protein